MYVVHFARSLFPFVAETEEDGLHEAASRVGLHRYEISPMRHKSRRLVLRDATGEIVALCVKTRNPFRVD
jgi:hypothetical protein